MCNPTQKLRFRGSFCDQNGRAEHRHACILMITTCVERSTGIAMIIVISTALDVIGVLHTSIHACRCIRFYTSATFKNNSAVYSRLLMIHQKTTDNRSASPLRWRYFTHGRRSRGLMPFPNRTHCSTNFKPLFVGNGHAY